MKVVAKPWGSEVIWAHTEHYVAKRLFIFAGMRLSRQYHVKKHETLRLVSGAGYIEVGMPGTPEFKRIDFNVATPAFVCPPGTIHRIGAYSSVDCEFEEVSTPELDDVVRLEDDHNR